MFWHRALRWWPPVGILAMIVLGVAVGKGSTPLDDSFIRFGEAHGSLRVLLFFTKPLVLSGILAIAVAVALYRRRWQFVPVIVLTPIFAICAVRALKQLFGREKEGAVAYPSGHVTLTVVVLGMLVLATGAAAWTIAAAVVFGVLGLFGVAVTFHYFTDTIGAALLGTALVCLAARATKLDRCQPGCDPDHNGG